MFQVMLWFHPGQCDGHNDHPPSQANPLKQVLRLWESLDTDWDKQRSRELVARWLHPKLTRLSQRQQPWNDWALNVELDQGMADVGEESPFQGSHDTFPTGQPQRVAYQDAWVTARVEMNVVNLFSHWVTLRCQYDAYWENRTALAPGAKTALHSFDSEEWQAVLADETVMQQWSIDTAQGVVQDVILEPAAEVTGAAKAANPLDPKTGTGHEGS